MGLTVAALALAWLVALVATPVARRTAFHIGCVDIPDGRRKLHRRPTPLLGGVAVVLGFMTAVSLITAVFVPLPTADEWKFILGLLLSGAAICIVGVCDDLWELGAGKKLVGQAAAAGILIAVGSQVRQVTAMGMTVDLGYLSIPFTLVWLLGAMNALNFIDGLDGLATGLGAIAATLFCVVAVASGKVVDAVAAAALAGSTLGFLRFNFPPARIFLGDAGSMFIGLVLGAISIHGSMKTPATLVFAVPAGLLAVPFLDGVVAILRRRLTGKALQIADRGHIHHCLLDRGLSPLQAVVCLWGLSIVTGLAALASFYWQNDAVALAAVAAVVGLLVASKSFAHHECGLLVSRIAAALAAARSLLYRQSQLPSRRSAEPTLSAAPGRFDRSGGTTPQGCQHAEVA